MSEQPATLLRTAPSWLLNRAAAIAQRLVTESLEEAGARRPHVALLAALAEFGPQSQADLGRRCGIDRSDMVALVNDLSGRAMVAREPDATDRRRNVITLTPAGDVFLADLRARLEESQAALLAGLAPDERHQLVALLTRVVESHPEFVAGGWAPAGNSRNSA
ncbi:MAG: MarR family winged helix-turn-helix transcriptional regulator [Thermomicrobiales bacterium]